MKKLALSLFATALWAQTPDWKEFSIGPPTRNQSGFSATGIRADGIPLKRALARAYGLPEHRIVGPDWIDTERYAIVAQVNDPKDFQPLFQKELAERFHMTVHRENKEVPVYVVKPIDGAPRPASKGERPNGAMGFTITATPQFFAETLADLIKRPVFDETGLDGKFEFSFFWKPGDWASLESAAKEQLGLRLVPEKRPVDLVIIEKIERLKFAKPSGAQ